MSRINLAEARELLARAVDTQGPDFIYNLAPGTGCYNVPLTQAGVAAIKAKYPHLDLFYDPEHPKTKTGCVAGTAMALSGRVPDMLDYATGSIGEFSAFLTPAASAYLREAQWMQDAGSTWGNARAGAERKFSEGLLAHISDV